MGAIFGCCALAIPAGRENDLRSDTVGAVLGRERGAIARDAACNQALVHDGKVGDVVGIKGGSFGIACEHGQTFREGLHASLVKFVVDVDDRIGGLHLSLF